MLNATILNIIMLNVIMLNVVMLNVTMLNVVCPSFNILKQNRNFVGERKKIVKKNFSNNDLSLPEMTSKVSSQKWGLNGGRPFSAVVNTVVEHSSPLPKVHGSSYAIVAGTGRG
jgi:hypothetical protein